MVETELSGDDGETALHTKLTTCQNYAKKKNGIQAKRKNS